MKPSFVLLACSILVATLLLQARGDDSCDDKIPSLLPCSDFVYGNGTSDPSSDCCSALGNVLQTQPTCLCSLLGTGGDVNKTRVVQLPKKCGLQTPSVSLCNTPPGSPGSYASPPPPPPPPDAGNSTKVSFGGLLSFVGGALCAGVAVLI